MLGSPKQARKVLRIAGNAANTLMINFVRLLKLRAKILASPVWSPLAYWTQHEAAAHSLGAAFNRYFRGACRGGA